MDEIMKIVSQAEVDCRDIFEEYDEIEFQNTRKVLEAFHEENINESDFASTTGYGYNDIGRDKIERVFARVLETEDAIVRNQFVSASHALAKTFFALLRPNDTLLSISGTPYDTLHEVIGISDNPSSLKSFGVNYKEIDLINDDFDYDKIEKTLKEEKIKVIEIQRSKGYSTRKSINLEKIEKVINFIRKIDKDVIIMIDNCYCEFTDSIEVGRYKPDIVVGSLIKNLGGGIAPNGAYVAGRSDLINLVGESLTLPGEGREVGPTLGINKSILQGLFLAPSVVASSMKTMTLSSCVLEKMGYDVEPTYNEKKSDIVLSIIFKNEEKLIKYVEGIQKSSPIDSNTVLIPSPMPGYDSNIIMASGSFTQGSSIEISCDGPIREPFIAYQQGGLTYQSGKYALINALEHLEK